MTDPDIFGMIIEGARLGAEFAAICGAYYFSGLIGLQALSHPPFQKLIKDQEELENVVCEEAEKIGLDPSKIKLIYGQESQIRGDGEGYELYLNKSETTRKLIKHELCHAVNDCHHRYTHSRYFLVAEPRATLYGTIGIKILWDTNAKDAALKVIT